MDEATAAVWLHGMRHHQLACARSTAAPSPHSLRTILLQFVLSLPCTLLYLCMLRSH